MLMIVVHYVMLVKCGEWSFKYWNSADVFAFCALAKQYDVSLFSDDIISLWIVLMFSKYPLDYCIVSEGNM